MSLEGHCNCGKIRVELQEVPDSCLLCYCDNCRRAGGLSSINYLLKTSTFTVQDATGALRKYADDNTASGTILERQFCGTCGSPILSMEPANPEAAFVKASLFDRIPAPSHENFVQKKPEWLGEYAGLACERAS